MKWNVWRFFLLTTFLVYLCGTFHAQALEIAPETDELMRCRVAAGFEVDDHFSKPPTSEAMALCRNVAEKSPHGAAYLARALYYAGQTEEAHRWILRAVQADLPVGHLLHGVAYENGYGVERSGWRALDYYRMAALTGHVNGNYNLARRLLDEKRTEAKWHEIIPSLNFAASRNYGPALNEIAWLKQRGVMGLASLGNPSDLYERAAADGDENALFNWATLNLRTNTSQSLKKLRAAAEMGHCPARILLANIYRYGRLIARDTVASVQLLKPCLGWYQAKWSLGTLARDGSITDISIEEARTYLSGALESMGDALQHKGDPAHYWIPGIEPSPSDEFLFELSLSGNTSGNERVKAAGSLKAHEIAQRLGPEATAEVLSDLVSEGYPSAVKKGANQLAIELGLQLKPIFRSPDAEMRGPKNSQVSKIIRRPILPLRPVDVARDLLHQDTVSNLALERVNELDQIGVEPIVKALLAVNSSKATSILVALAKERHISLPVSVYAAELNSFDEKRRLNAIEAAAFNGLVLAEDKLAQLAHDKSESVRISLFTNSTRAGWNFTPSILVNALQSPAPGVVEAATRAASLTHDQEVRRQLVSMLGGHNGDSAAAALRFVGFGDTGEDFVRTLSDADFTGKREGIVNALRSIQPQQIATIISEMLNSHETTVRMRALKIIKESGSHMHERFVTELALRDSDPDIRRAAVLILTGSWSPDYLRVLEAATYDVSPSVRALALEGLASDRLIPEMRARQLAKDPDPFVRYLAAKALKDQGYSPSSDVAINLLTDADDRVRKVFLVENTATEIAADLKLWKALPKAESIKEVCYAAHSKQHTLGVLLEIASDRTLEQDMRSRALYCVRYLPKIDFTEDQIALLDAIARDPTSDSFLISTTLDILEKSINPSAARAVMRQVFTHISTCSIRRRMSSFPEQARNEAARDYLRVPSIAVQQYALECMGTQGAFAKYVVRSLKVKNEALSPAEVDALTQLKGEEGARVLLNLLPSVTESDDRLALLQGLWETRSGLAHEHAMTYRGPLPAASSAFSAWAWVIAEKPSEAALDRLLLELSRLSQSNEESVYAALTLSSRLPSAKLKKALVMPLLDIIGREILSWELQNSNALMSPLAFLTQCLRSSEIEGHEIASNYVNNEYARMLPEHAEAISRAFRQCSEWRTSTGQSYPRTFQGIAKRLILGANLIEDANSLGPTANEALAINPMLLLAEAEIQSQLGNHAGVLPLLEKLEQQGLNFISAEDKAKEYFLRISWLRGNSLAALGHRQEAIGWLRLASAKSGRQSSGLLATAELIRLGTSPNYSTARWMADEFNMQGQSGPQVHTAMVTIMEHLIEVEANAGNIEQSLIDADRLGALAIAGTRFAPIALVDKDKESALRQLLELEQRVVGAETKSPTDAAVARQRLQAWLADIRMRYPAMVGFLRPQPARLAEIRSTLGPDRALVQYVVLPSRSYVWVVSQSVQRLIPIAMGARQIYTAVAQVRSGILNASTSKPTYQDAIRTLSAALVAPVLSITNAQHWVVVPHASLHGLPFSVLKAEGELALVSKLTISIAMSSASVGNLRRSAIPDSNSQLLAIGGASPFDSSLAPLPFAKKEVEDIAAILPGINTVKTGRDSSKKLLSDNGSFYGRALHLAIHGQVQPGDQSRLVFADGYMTVREIWGLPLRGSPRVVLSACESGLGETLTGNEVLSLANAFLVAGAESVVSTLWPVRDASTAKLMRDFYESLALGRSTAQALSDAQRIAIAAEWPPDRWAGFSVHGW